MFATWIAQELLNRRRRNAGAGQQKLGKLRGGPGRSRIGYDRRAVSHLLSIASLLLTITILPNFAYLLLLSLGALLRRRSLPEVSGPAVQPRFLIVIPAHDEAGTIAGTIAGCQQLLYERSRFSVWVIADNCEDDTAQIARRSGARVLERRDPDRRAKGYALEYFFAHPTCAEALHEAEAAVIIDADTAVDPGLLRGFAAHLSRGRQWLQAYYRVGNPEASWRTRLLTLAFALFNGTWLLGQQWLGLSVALRGNGMCFTTAALRRHPWSTYGLAEDVEFSWQLRLRGQRVYFAPEAEVSADMVKRGGQAAANQRLRWEVGRRQLRRMFRKGLLGSEALSKGQKLLYLIDLYSLPLSRLGFLYVLALLPQGVALCLGLPVSGGLFGVQALMALTLAVYFVTPFVAMGLPARYALSLLYAPPYLLWKFALLFRRKPTRWVRTERE